MLITLEEAYEKLHAHQDVLIVEDDEDVRLTLSELLSAAGYRVRTADDGFAGLAELEARRPNFILLDLSMPGMNGWMFMAELRRRLHAAMPPVVLLSARNDLAQQAARLGVDRFLTKPFRIKELYRMLEACA